MLLPARFALAAFLVVALVLGPAQAQEAEREPSLAEQLDLADRPQALKIEVTLEGQRRQLPLETRLTWRQDLPQAARVPGILLIHGSSNGAVLRKDVDGTIPAEDTADNKPAKRFRDLAYTLAQAGFVVLRCAKRGYALDARQDRLDVVATTTFDSTLADNRRALQLLAQAPRVDPRRLILCGHSEGSMVAPILARESEAVSGLILLGTVVDFGRVVRYQLVERPTERLFAACDQDEDGRLDRAELIRARARYDDLPYVVYRPDDHDTDGDRALSRAEVEAELVESRFAVHKQQAVADRQSYWHGHYTRPTNLELLPKLPKKKLLVIQGLLDWRTPTHQVRALELALRRARHPAARFEYLPGLGHGYSPPRTRQTRELSPSETAGPPSARFQDALARLARETFLAGEPDQPAAGR